VPVAELAAAGARRISLGGALYRVAMGAVEASVRALAAGDMAACLDGALPSGAFTKFFPGA